VAVANRGRYPFLLVLTAENNGGARLSHQTAKSRWYLVLRFALRAVVRFQRLESRRAHYRAGRLTEIREPCVSMHAFLPCERTRAYVCLPKRGTVGVTGRTRLGRVQPVST